MLLDTIEKNNNITQRELSKRTGLSLGSINLLLNKMISEGFIKIEQIPPSRVVYMLTPKGILEKVNKTYNYIRIHYRHITESKNKIKEYITILINEGKTICILHADNEVGDLCRSAIKELIEEDEITNIKEIHDKNKSQACVLKEITANNANVLIIMNNDDSATYDSYDLVVINILSIL